MLFSLYIQASYFRRAQYGGEVLKASVWYLCHILLWNIQPWWQKVEQ